MLFLFAAAALVASFALRASR